MLAQATVVACYWKNWKTAASSNNTVLIPNPVVTYTTAEATGSLAFTPVADQYGTATITVTVEDAGDDGDLDKTANDATFSRTFDVTVNPVNDVPIASDASYQPPENSVFEKDAAQGLASLIMDIDQDNLAFTVVTNPAHGQLVKVKARGQQGKHH